jgi:hypothetical protein
VLQGQVGEHEVDLLVGDALEGAVARNLEVVDIAKRLQVAPAPPEHLLAYVNRDHSRK